MGHGANVEHRASEARAQWGMGSLWSTGSVWGTGISGVLRDQWDLGISVGHGDQWGTGISRVRGSVGLGAAPHLRGTSWSAYLTATV